MRLKKFSFKTVNSTNDTALRIIKNTNIKSGFISAEKQKKGRGQYNKKWISYKGNLFISIYFSLEKINLSLKQLTRLNCMLVKKVLSNYYKKKIFIKNPNDLLINKKKISGILQETVVKKDIKFIIIGIGINLVRKPTIKDYPTTSLYELTKIKYKKENIENKIKLIFESFIPKLSKFNLNSIKTI